MSDHMELIERLLDHSDPIQPSISVETWIETARALLREAADALAAPLVLTDEIVGRGAGSSDAPVADVNTPSRYDTSPHTPTEGAVERFAFALHNAYEAAAPKHGWETQAKSRTAWENLPYANKATMLEACGTALSAAHEAGEIVWREEYAVLERRARTTQKALDVSARLGGAEKARADEAVALLRDYSRIVATGTDEETGEWWERRAALLASQEPPTQEGPA